jgi:hypothetical protein
VTLVELAVLYALVGGGIAVACLAAHRAGPADAALLVPLWPLWGPFLLLRAQDEPEGDASAAELSFLNALRRAARTPLGKLLPDAQTARILGRRLRTVEGRLREIDRVLARGGGLPDSAVRTLTALRDRHRTELEEVGSLLKRLTAQAEVVWLLGATDPSSTDLVRELVARVEGLDQVLDDPCQTPS